jgi:hypothetical protein
MREVWKDVVGFEGLYKISCCGSVLSLRNKKVLSPLTTPAGYWKVILFGTGKKRQVEIHRLIAEAFIPNPQNKPWVDHIDRDRRNNSISNLRFVSPGESHQNKAGWGRKSKFRGVVKVGSRWGAKIGHNKQVYWLGTFVTEEDAARAYNKMSLKLHGDTGIRSLL